MPLPDHDGRRNNGRIPGTPNRNTTELRLMIQDAVREFTTLRHRQDIEQGKTAEEAQQIHDEWDPVVQLSLVSVDDRNPRDMRNKCAAEVAQYVRPKLKSVEMMVDPEALETLEERRQLSHNLVQLLEAAASAKKGSKKKS